MVREVYDSLFFPSYLSFPLEGNSRAAGKGVRGRAPIGCSIAVLTANRRPPEQSDATFLHNPWHRGLEARWMPYAPLRRRRRPLREYWKAPVPVPIPTAPYFASAAILYNSRGRSTQPVREASAGPGQNLWRPRPSGPAAPSTLAAKPRQPSGIPASTAQVPVPIPTTPQACP